MLCNLYTAVEWCWPGGHGQVYTVQCPWPITGQQNVQLYYEDDQLCPSIGILFIYAGNNIINLSLAVLQYLTSLYRLNKVLHLDCDTKSAPEPEPGSGADRKRIGSATQVPGFSGVLSRTLIYVCPVSFEHLLFCNKKSWTLLAIIFSPPLTTSHGTIFIYGF